MRTGTFDAFEVLTGKWNGVDLMVIDLLNYVYVCFCLFVCLFVFC